MEKKKIKKLVLKKEEIVNLNEYQMKRIQGGGSSGLCLKTVSMAYSLAKSIYSIMEDNSWMNCEYSNQENCMTNISDKIVNLPDGSQACEIPNVDIYGYRP